MQGDNEIGYHIERSTVGKLIAENLLTNNQLKNNVTLEITGVGLGSNGESTNFDWSSLKTDDSF